MGATKQYAPPDVYVRKLARVMEKLGVEKYDYNFDRHGCWVEFFYEGELYRFDHSVEKAREHGVINAFAPKRRRKGKRLRLNVIMDGTGRVEFKPAEGDGVSG